MTVAAKAIPTGSPVTDVTRVKTPPIIGPIGGAHLWMARTQRGLSSTVTKLPDLLGAVDLTTAGTAATFTDSTTTDPSFTTNGSSRLQGTGSSADSTTDRTILLVARLVNGNTQQVSVPGYSPMGASGTSVYVAGVTIAANLPASGMAVIAIRIDSTASQTKVSVNGGATTTGALPTKGAGLTYWIGCSAVSPATSDTFGMLKTWQRVLTDTELAQAITDAKTLFGL